MCEKTEQRAEVVVGKGGPWVVVRSLVIDPEVPVKDAEAALRQFLYDDPEHVGHPPGTERRIPMEGGRIQR